MKLIVTHEKPDFDAVAGLALAQLAHPGAVAAIDGNRSDRIREFLRLYRDELPLERNENIDPDEVTELIVVDTNDADRLGPFAGLVDRVPVTLYDHHPRHKGEIRASYGVQEQVGSTATLLTRHLVASNTNIPAPIATLALLAIHEDTGNLTFDLTTAADYQAAAQLMRAGASLQVLRQFQAEDRDQDQRDLLSQAARHAQIHEMSGYRLITSAFSFPTYVRDAARVCDELLRESRVDAALMAVEMEGKTLVFARSERGFDMGGALSQALGGGGHPGAAFARTDEEPEGAIAATLKALPAHSRPAQTARTVMSTPVKTLAVDTTVREAQSLLERYGHNGAPVVQDGELVGIVSRRDLDRALRHDMGDAPISGFMTREIVWANPQTPLRKIEELVQQHNIGRIPIVAEGQVVGIVTRSDLLRARHDKAREGVPAHLRERLPREALEILELAGDHLRDATASRRPEAALYVVGGTVRDLLLGKALLDLDLVVEGYDAGQLVSHLQRRLGGRMSFHTAFNTSTLELHSGLTVDIAQAREEFYAHPGALPQVTPSSIHRDLGRRDFTINALAVRVYPEPPQLLDPFAGQTDLERKVLRPLHPLSFIEDPTRILRGARLGARLGFDFSAHAKELVRGALQPEVLDRVSTTRLRGELELAFAERRVEPVLARLRDLGVLEGVYGLQLDSRLVEGLDNLREKAQVPPLSYLLALLTGNDETAAQRHVERFNWPQRYLDIRRRLVRARDMDSVGPDELEASDEAERAVLRVLSPALRGAVLEHEQEPNRRRLRGKDVLELGLQPGPQVGHILDEVAAARQRGQVRSFEQELTLARQLVESALRGQEQE